MTETKPISRLEADGDRLRVVTKEWMDLNHFRKQNVLTAEHEDLFVHVVPGVEQVRVGTAARAGDAEGFHIHGANGIYFESPLTERELSDAEVAWCEDTFMYGGDSLPETVWEFAIPAPEQLRAAILDEDLDAFDGLDAVIPDHERRHAVLTDLQERIETENLRATKLSPRKGYPRDLEPEWHPESDHNDDRDQEYLHDMASSRKDAHLLDFEPIAGFDYSTFFNARVQVLGIHERWLEPYELVALDVAGVPDWSYCQECGGVAPAELFLHVDLRGYDGERTRRVCDDCLARRAGRLELPDDEWTRGPWTEDAAAKAKDERAQRLGGQRRIGGDYSPAEQEGAE